VLGLHRIGRAIYRHVDRSALHKDVLLCVALVRVGVERDPGVDLDIVYFEGALWVKSAGPRFGLHGDRAVGRDQAPFVGSTRS
jgi:hypothetical protein